MDYVSIFSHKDKNNIFFLCIPLSWKKLIMKAQLYFVALTDEYLSVSKSHISTPACSCTEYTFT